MTSEKMCQICKLTMSKGLHVTASGTYPAKWHPFEPSEAPMTTPDKPLCRVCGFTKDDLVHPEVRNIEQDAILGAMGRQSHPFEPVTEAKIHSPLCAAVNKETCVCPVTEVLQPKPEGEESVFRMTRILTPEEAEFLKKSQEKVYGPWKKDRSFEEGFAVGRSSRDDEMEKLVGALKEMGAIAYAVLDFIIPASRTQDEWLAERKSEYAECYKALADHEKGKP